MPKVAYLGPAGTFTEKVTREVFPNGELIPVSTNRGVIRQVEAGETEQGVVPIENFYNGEVREVLDALRDCGNVRIVAEKALTIIHCLGALHEHGTIGRVLSKDQALEQSSSYLYANYPDAQIIAVSSTAEAVSQIKTGTLLDSAAIAAEKAITDGGLEVLARDICPNNKTRFAILGREITTAATGDDKTFLAIHPPEDRPGVLANLLNIFSAFGVNLEYIQSRPDRKSGYWFYVELDGHVTEGRISHALETINASLNPQGIYSDIMRVLGSYANSRWKVNGSKK